MARTGPKPEIQGIETIPNAPETFAIPTAEELRALYDASAEEIEIEEPDAGERAMDLHGGPVNVAAVEEMVRSQAYSDESSKLYIGRIFKPVEFAAWYAAQRIGSLPFNGVSIHHTYIPDHDDFNGVATIHGVFNYYANTLKWPRGRGPHFWLYGGDGRYGTQPLIGVGTHPAHDGIAVSWRNHRWAAIEAFGYYDSRAMPQSMIDLYRFTLQTIGGSRIPIKDAGAGVDGPKSAIGQIFHRNAPDAGKSCPGWQVKGSWFFPAMQKKTPAPTPPKPPPVSDVDLGPYRKDSVTIIDRYFGTSYGRIIAEEADKAGLDLALSCALVEQESNGKHIFGHDWGTHGVDRLPFAGLPVTKDRFDRLVAHVRAGGVSNGAGLAQPTYKTYLFEMAATGEGHTPRIALRTGFKVLAQNLDSYGYEGGIGAYNAGGGNRNSVRWTYTASVIQKHGTWKKRLA